MSKLVDAITEMLLELLAGMFGMKRPKKRGR